jgi:Tfp pilus assembly protein PilX
VTSRLGQERGWALVTTILVMAILAAIALPLMTMVDTQQAGSAAERKSEGSFNVSEAALNSMVFLLSSEWPADSTSSYPAACNQSSTTTTCPDSGAIARTYQGGDFSNLAWTVQVRDDNGSEYYDEAAVASRPTWDSNENGKLWVLSHGRSSGRSRVVVALVRMHEQVETFPRRVINAGWFATTNNGNKVIVDTRGDAAEPAALAVRCNNHTSLCLGYNRDKGQVSPDIVETGTAGETAVAQSVLDGFRERAQALGTYYASGCPSSPTGTLVFVENANCSYGGGGQANSPTSPGMIVINRGTITFGGNFEYYGLVYAANRQRSVLPVIMLTGTSEIIGSVSVDYGGGVLAGASGRNITYSEQVLPEIRSHRTVGIVQGSWRELPSS